MLAVSQSLWYFSKRTRADTKYTKVVPKLSMASMTHVAVAAHMPARQADSQYSLSCCKNIPRQICESHRWLKFVFLKNTFALKIVHVYITAKCAPSKMFHGTLNKRVSFFYPFQTVLHILCSLET